jgi:hypothetical protein
MTKMSAQAQPKPSLEPQQPSLAQNAILAVFDRHEDAEDAVRAMQRSGFDMHNLSIVGKGYRREEFPVGFYTAGDRMKTWGGVGAFWGALWGILMGAVFFWVPGFGPLAVAGPFVHLIVTGLEGAALVGGLSALGGALSALGLPKERVLKYETQLRSDKYLLIAHGSAEQVQRAREILEHSQAVETEILKEEE